MSSLLKPGSRFAVQPAAIASVVATVAATVALLPVDAQAAGTVTCAPCTVVSTAGRTIVFTTSDSFSAVDVEQAHPTVTLTGPDDTDWQADSATVTPGDADPTTGTEVQATFDTFRDANGVLAAPGMYSVTITGGSLDSGTTDTAADLVTMDGPGPGQATVTPGLAAADTGQNLVVKGTDFATGDQIDLVSFDGKNPNVSGLPVGDDYAITESNGGVDTLSGTFDLSGVGPGKYNLVVTHPWATDPAKKSSPFDATAYTFQVVAAPSITAVNPPAVGQGAGPDGTPAPVEIRARNFPTVRNGVAVSTDDADVRILDTSQDPDADVDGVLPTVEDIKADPVHPAITVIKVGMSHATDADTGDWTL